MIHADGWVAETGSNGFSLSAHWIATGAHCKAESPRLGGFNGWACWRDRGHPGRHMGSSSGDGVIVAWPGTHCPTESDLEGLS